MNKLSAAFSRALCCQRHFRKWDRKQTLLDSSWPLFTVTWRNFSDQKPEASVSSAVRETWLYLSSRGFSQRERVKSKENMKLKMTLFTFLIRLLCMSFYNLCTIRCFASESSFGANLTKWSTTHSSYSFSFFDEYFIITLSNKRLL